MQVPLDIMYRDVEKTDALETLIRSKVDKLEEVCDHIIGCHVAVGKAHENPDHGSPYLVRVDVTVPPGHEITTTKNPAESVQYVPLETVIRDAFEATRRQLVELVDRQQDQVKSHPEQSVAGIVIKLMPQNNYGFLKTVDGREVYFHRNSVLQNDYDRLTVGTGVQFFLSEGINGPQASTVRIISKPGVRSEKAEDQAAPVEPPAGWQ
ncbi:DNA-binding protein [filamentous cyanobacterium CCP5]|nr:DNA-binding protein [filamentous cyanobacterium CCP5]